MLSADQGPGLVQVVDDQHAMSVRRRTDTGRAP